MMRRMVFLVGALGWMVWFPTLSIEAETWRTFPRYGGCIGGRTCDARPIEVPLENRPVLRVRFFADDDVGSYGGGRLRVTLDGRQIARELILDRRGRTYTLEVRGLTGRALRFEASGSEEVNLRSIEVLYDEGRYREDRYGSGSRGERYDDRGSVGRGRGGQWARYRNERGCIGGERCRADSLRIRLFGEPVERLRFFAHDDFGLKFDGQVRVYLDDRIVARRIDVDRQGRQHILDADGRRADYLIFEAVTQDEVMISDIEVLYQGHVYDDRRDDDYLYDDRGSSRYQTGYGGPGDCIGGELCSDRVRIEVTLEGLPIEAVRFHAHSDVGDRSEGLLRVQLDREVLEEELDVPRRGDFYQYDLGEARGRLLTFEAVGRGEVVVEDIEVRYEGQAWTRHRVEESKRR